MTHTPYDYQRKAYTDVLSAFDAGHRAVGVALPTRAGKSIVALQLVEHFYAESVWFIAHTHILIRQMSEELTANGIRHGIIAPKYPELRLNVQVISKDTLFNRLERMLATGWKPPRLLIVDEAHMSMSPRYMEVLTKLPGCNIVGLSATWIRLDRKPFNPPFTYLVMGPSIKQLQTKGKICDIDTLIVDRFDDEGVSKTGGDYSAHDLEVKLDQRFILKNVVAQWQKYALGKKTLVFCVSIKHATDMAAEFTESGHEARCLSSKDGPEHIKATLADFYAGKFKVLASVELFVMGFTVRDCECICQCRPSQSVMIYMQCLGRGFMTAPGKPHLINLDFVNNFDRHGFPEADRDWTLDTPPPKDKGESKYKTCPDCQRPVLKTVMECPHCRYIWQKRIVVRELNEVDGQMIRPGDKQAKQQLVLAIARGARTLEQARDIAVRAGAGIADGEEVWRVYLKNA